MSGLVAGVSAKDKLLQLCWVNKKCFVLSTVGSKNRKRKENSFLFKKCESKLVSSRILFSYFCLLESTKSLIEFSLRKYLQGFCKIFWNILHTFDGLFTSSTQAFWNYNSIAKIALTKENSGLYHFFALLGLAAN